MDERKAQYRFFSRKAEEHKEKLRKTGDSNDAKKYFEFLQKQIKINEDVVREITKKIKG